MGAVEEGVEVEVEVGFSNRNSPHFPLYSGPMTDISQECVHWLLFSKVGDGRPVHGHPR